SGDAIRWKMALASTRVGRIDAEIIAVLVAVSQDEQPAIRAETPAHDGTLINTKDGLTSAQVPELAALGGFTREHQQSPRTKTRSRRFTQLRQRSDLDIIRDTANGAGPFLGGAGVQREVLTHFGPVNSRLEDLGHRLGNVDIGQGQSGDGVVPELVKPPRR